MVDVLNSVLIKHDNNFKSLTKIALSQILLKIVYESKSAGINANSIKSNAESYVDSKFDIKDIENALIHLKNEQKISVKANKYYVKPEYRDIIDKSVQKSEELHESVIEFWFSETETFRNKNTKQNIHKWFNKIMVNFFKDYRYDWINDLKNKKILGKRKTFNIDKILLACFDKIEITTEDKPWLISQFIKFLESEREADNELLWSYGSSMFSATLLTAMNYADDFSIDIFKDSYFIFDTNILMTIGLEGHELNYAFEPIEQVFKALNIKPVYFFITREEYRRAISKKRNATFHALDSFGYDVIKETECGIIATAIKRKCISPEDFEDFFNQIEEIPNVIYSDLEIVCEDSFDLNDAIEKGQYDEDTQEKINTINFSRNGHNKSKNVLQHDAGLVQGASFLKKKSKCWILTKDSTIREYANKNILRNENPIAIGLDSFIQMMAINNGNIGNQTTNFAPLFAKIVQFSLLPEKNMFKVEDLEFILDTKIGIENLKKEDILQIAKDVNKLRVQNKPDDDIALEVRRSFQKKKTDYDSDTEKLKVRNYELEEISNRSSKQTENLKSELFKQKYQPKKSELKRKITFNWLKFIGIPIIVMLLLGIVFILNLIGILSSISCILLNIVASLIFGFKFKPKLFYTDKDDFEIREQIDREISQIIHMN